MGVLPIPSSGQPSVEPMPTLLEDTRGGGFCKTITAIEILFVAALVLGRPGAASTHERVLTRVREPLHRADSS